MDEERRQGGIYPVERVFVWKRCESVTQRCFKMPWAAACSKLDSRRELERTRSTRFIEGSTCPETLIQEQRCLSK